MALSKAQIQVGDSRQQVLTEDLTRTQIVQYAGASGDYNPLHTDGVYATAVAGYPGVFAHGMLLMAMTARALTDWVGDGTLTAYGVRFTSQVWPGDWLTALLTVADIREENGGHVVDLSVTTTNGRGEEVVSGTATARLLP